MRAAIPVKASIGASRLAWNDVNTDFLVFIYPGAIAIAKNTIDGNFQCKKNSPAPTGGGNIVQGNKEDQCRSL